MNCSKIDKLMLDYVYEELAPDKVLAFERHIAECPECARALGEIQFTRSAMRNAEVKVPSGAAIEAIMREAESSVASEYSIPARRERMASWRPFLAGAACIMLMLGVIQAVFQPFTKTVTKTVPGPVRIVERQVEPLAARPVSFDEAAPPAQPAQTGRMSQYRIEDLRKIIPQADDAIEAKDWDKLRQLYNDDFGGIIKTQTQLLSASLMVELSSASGHDNDPEIINTKLNHTLYLATNGYVFEAFTMLKIMQRDTDRNNKLYYLVPARLGFICEALDLPDRARKYYELAMADEHISPKHKADLEGRIAGLDQTQNTTD